MTEIAARDALSNAIRYWEPRRILYNTVVLLVVAVTYWANLPSSRAGLNDWPNASQAQTRAQVDAFHAAALKVGRTDNGPPRLRNIAEGYPPGYYAAFVLDPDGNNIEAVFREI